MLNEKRLYRRIIKLAYKKDEISLKRSKTSLNFESLLISNNKKLFLY